MTDFPALYVIFQEFPSSIVAKMYKVTKKILFKKLMQILNSKGEASVTYERTIFSCRS